MASSGNDQFTMTIPNIFQVEEGKEQTLTFNNIFPTSAASLLTSVPWRLIGARLEVACVNVKGGDPAIVQLGFHSATTTNVEMISWCRFMVGTLPRVRTLFMSSPNIWKEEENKGQVLISVKNVGQGTTTNNTINCHMEVKVNFRGQPYPTKSTINFPFASLPLQNADSIAANLALSMSEAGSSISMLEE